jgi:predicted amidophosphoribosyltransferase
LLFLSFPFVWLFFASSRLCERIKKRRLLMLVGGVERCARCGTQLRAGRSVCPSCGLDQAASETQPEQISVSEPAEAPRPAPAKKTICPSCMTSVLESTMVDYQDGRICPECAERMKNKAQRKG